MRNPETGLGKGFAFVRYVSAEAAAVRARSQGGKCCGLPLTRAASQAAVEHLDGLEVCGRAVGVVRSQANTQLFVGGCAAAFVLRRSACAFQAGRT